MTLSYRGFNFSSPYSNSRLIFRLKLRIRVNPVVPTVPQVQDASSCRAPEDTLVNPSLHSVAVAT